MRGGVKVEGCALSGQKTTRRALLPASSTTERTQQLWMDGYLHPLQLKSEPHAVQRPRLTTL